KRPGGPLSSALSLNYMSSAKPTSAACRLPHQCGNRGWQLESERKFMSSRTHFSPCFPDDIDELLARILRVLRRERADLVFQKHEAGGVFKGLSPWICFQPGFRNPRCDFAGFPGGNAGFEQERPGAFGLFDIERF